MPRRFWLHVLLFLLTIASTWITWGGVYSISVMLILLGHELGHYFMSRRYGIPASLPFFLPFPLPPFGTLGAVIKMGGIVSSRKALFDVGSAGPLTSFCLSIPAVIIGLKFSTVIPLSQVRGEVIRMSDPFLFSLIQRLVAGPIPQGHDILIHPIGYAGWVGLFVTALNLLPVGQLDGGHIVYAIFGRRSRRLFFLTIVAMAFITFFYNPGWILLLVLIIVFGFRHPAPWDDETPLDPKRKAMGGVMLLIFLLSFNPVPFPELIDTFKRFMPWL
jgi:membrane-associated protease RseP (regulator of RpoE activity)